MNIYEFTPSAQRLAGMLVLSRVVYRVQLNKSFNLLDNCRQQLAKEIVPDDLPHKAYHGLEIAAILSYQANKIANYLLSEDSENDKS